MNKFLIIFYNEQVKDWINKQEFPVIIRNHAFFKNKNTLEQNTEILKELSNNIVLVELTNPISVIFEEELNKKEIINNILDKIILYGIDSLSENEKNFLSSYE